MSSATSIWSPHCELNSNSSPFLRPPHSILSSSQWEILIPSYPLLNGSSATSMWSTHCELNSKSSPYKIVRPPHSILSSTLWRIDQNLWEPFVPFPHLLDLVLCTDFLGWKNIFLDEKIFSWMKKYFLSFFHFQILTSPASVTGSRESYLLVSVISWVRLQSGNNQKSVSALHTTVSDSVTFCSVVYIYCFGKCLGLLCQLHCHVLKIRSKIVGGSAIDFEFLMSTDGAKRVRYGW